LNSIEISELTDSLFLLKNWVF